MHKITLGQIRQILNECKRQLPLLENSLTEPMVISALVAEKMKLVDQDLFDAAEFIRSFNPSDFDNEEEEVAIEEAAVVKQQHGPRYDPGG